MTKAERWLIYGLIGRLVRGEEYCKSLLHNRHTHPEAAAHIKAAIAHLSHARSIQSAHTKELLK